MILKWLLTFILLVFGILLLSSVTWFDGKRSLTEQFTQGYRDNIIELQNIKYTNQWIRDVVIPNFSTMPLSKANAELDMINFYDRYTHTYNFKVSQFIYYDTSAKMDIGFSFIPKNQDAIDRFLALHYEKGFLQIQNISSKEGTISGVLTIIQPMQGDINASGQ
ncbi:MAG: hypothetical protein V2A75_10165 [Pseudomonadota bacterium]